MWRMDAQRRRYGPHLYIKDEEGYYHCFFLGCHQRCKANFSRHIESHERKNEMVDKEMSQRQMRRYQGQMKQVTTSSITSTLTPNGSSSQSYHHNHSSIMMANKQGGGEGNRPYTSTNLGSDISSGRESTMDSSPWLQHTLPKAPTLMNHFGLSPLAPSQFISSPLGYCRGNPNHPIQAIHENMNQLPSGLSHLLWPTLLDSTMTSYPQHSFLSTPHPELEIPWPTCSSILNQLCLYCDQFPLEKNPTSIHIQNSMAVTSVSSSSNLHSTMTLANCFFEPFRVNQWTELTHVANTYPILDLGIILRQVNHLEYNHLEDFINQVHQVLNTIHQICTNTTNTNTMIVPLIPASTLAHHAMTLLRLFDALIESERLTLRFACYEKHLVAHFHPSIELTLEGMIDLLDRLWHHPLAAPFRDPVDHIALELPDYPILIKEPMDLSTIYKASRAGDYQVSTLLFARHVRWIWKNAMVYNELQSDIHKHAEQLAYLFEDQLKEAYQEASHAKQRYGRYAIRDKEHRLLFWDPNKNAYYYEYYEEEDGENDSITPPIQPYDKSEADEDEEVDEYDEEEDDDREVENDHDECEMEDGESESTSALKMTVKTEKMKSNLGSKQISSSTQRLEWQRQLSTTQYPPLDSKTGRGTPIQTLRQQSWLNPSTDPQWLVHISEKNQGSTSTKNNTASTLTLSRQQPIYSPPKALIRFLTPTTSSIRSTSHVRHSSMHTSAHTNSQTVS